jgi:uncharacterized protein YndB with AHSA1/START domain
LREEEPMEVRRETVFEAEREQVWAALTDPERLREWFANDVELDARPGGSGTFRWDDGSARYARVERVDETREFEFLWWDEDGGESVVSISLADCEEGTRVTVVESAAAAGLHASAEWSWGIELLASLARLRPFARPR